MCQQKQPIVSLQLVSTVRPSARIKAGWRSKAASFIQIHAANCLIRVILAWSAFKYTPIGFLTPIQKDKRWFIQLRRAAKPAKTAPVFAPRRLNVPVARNSHCTAPATRRQLRISSRGLAAHAVCCFCLLMRASRVNLGLYTTGARPVGECTCERAPSENQPVMGVTCPCGKRPECKFLFFFLKKKSLRI